MALKKTRSNNVDNKQKTKLKKNNRLKRVDW